MSTAAFAQSSRPGPYVFDLSGVTAGAPAGVGFYPVVAPGTIVPTRGFGLGLGAHVYPFQLGLARIGIGAEAMRTRATSKTPAVVGSTAATSTFASDAKMDVTSVAGQISFNFGTRDGWSYLSAGYGAIRTRSQVSSDVLGPIQHSVVVLKQHSPAINYGGGARWFLRERMAVGFDVRFHRLSSPSKQIVGLSVGLSVR
jgi:hypothetical protein